VDIKRSLYECARSGEDDEGRLGDLRRTVSNSGYFLGRIQSDECDDVLANDENEVHDEHSHPTGFPEIRL
jgi:hypothetical protein